MALERMLAALQGVEWLAVDAEGECQGGAWPRGALGGGVPYLGRVVHTTPLLGLAQHRQHLPGVGPPDAGRNGVTRCVCGIAPP